MHHSSFITSLLIAAVIVVATIYTAGATSALLAAGSRPASPSARKTWGDLAGNAVLLGESPRVE